MSVVMLTAVGLAPFSFALAGAVVDVSLYGLFLGAGGVVLVLTLYVALRGRTVRRRGSSPRPE